MLSGQNHGIYKKLYSSIYLSNNGSSDFLKKSRNHKPALKSLSNNFYDDKSARCRSKAYALSRNIYNYTDKKELKQQVVEDHLSACLNDRSPYLRYRLGNHLIQFEKEDFNDMSVTMIKELIAIDQNRKHYVVLAGYMNLDEAIPDISQFTEDDIIKEWDIVQGLARVGNPEALAICTKIMKEYPLDKRFFDKLLPGLSYTNDRQIFDLIIDEILSDDNTELIGQRLKDYQRYFLLKSIMPLIYEYPFSFVDESQLMEDEFYHQLEYAMDWLRKNRESYTLIHMESSMLQKKSPYISDELTTSMK